MRFGLTPHGQGAASTARSSRLWPQRNSSTSSHREAERGYLQSLTTIVAACKVSSMESQRDDAGGTRSHSRPRAPEGKSVCPYKLANDWKPRGTAVAGGHVSPAQRSDRHFQSWMSFTGNWRTKERFAFTSDNGPRVTSCGGRRPNNLHALRAWDTAPARAWVSLSSRSLASGSKSPVAASNAARPVQQAEAPTTRGYSEFGLHADVSTLRTQLNLLLPRTGSLDRFPLDHEPAKSGGWASGPGGPPDLPPRVGSCTSIASPVRHSHDHSNTGTR